MFGGTLLAGGGGIGHRPQPRRPEHRRAREKLGDLIPDTVGPWRFENSNGIVVAREDGPVDGYDQLVSRKYRAAGLPEVMLLAAYGSTQGGMLQLHRPETCYPAQGFALSDFSEIAGRGDGRPAVDPSPGMARHGAGLINVGCALQHL
ncbi:MAG: EpsI family protein [Novosphingobium sp.]